MRVVVTGGAGFIGSHLIDTLIGEGHEVVCLDKDINGHWNECSTNYVGDVCDSDLVNTITKDIDVVFHLAAELQIQETINFPVHCYNTNVIGTAIVLDACKNNNVSKFILSSTSAVYECNTPSQSETSKESYLNPYASSKKAAEELCKLYSTLYGLDTTIFRYFNVYGKRQHTQGQYAPVLGIFMKQKENGDELTITGDGNQRRDFVHVDDVVNANISAANIESPPGRVYNVGRGCSHSIREIANMISSKQTYIDKRVGEIDSTLANINRIKKELNWEPTVDLDSWITSELEIQNEQHTKR
jgi:UDP-glucose 4-epimerase